MAPRRGGGGGFRGGSSSSSNTCPGAFKSYYSTEVAYFVAYCIFFVVNFFIAINAPKIKKKHPHVKATKLISWLFGFCVFFYVLAYALLIIDTMLRECDTVGSQVYNQLIIAIQIFFRLAEYLLLVLVLASVNHTLRKVVGNNPAIFTIVYACIATLMFIIMAAYVGLNSYYISSINGSGSTMALLKSTNNLRLAYYVLYMLVVLVAGAGAIMSVVQLRSARRVTGSLAIWVPCLYCSMLVWVVFNVALSASAINLESSWPLAAYEAFEYVSDFFQALSLIAILCIAKDNALANHPGGFAQPAYNNGYAPQQPPQQQYAYNQQQPEYAYGQPVYQMAGTPVNGAKP